MTIQAESNFTYDFDEMPLRIGHSAVAYFEPTAHVHWVVEDGELMVEVTRWTAHGIDLNTAAARGNDVAKGLLAACEAYAAEPSSRSFFRRMALVREGSDIRDHLYSDKREHALPQSAFI